MLETIQNIFDWQNLSRIIAYGIIFIRTDISLRKSDLRQFFQYFHILSYCSGVFVIIVNKHTRGEIKRILLRLTACTV